uniref:Uncharacterized protein n=1 Tax=Arundo donax TaxID=35708 RepID=A0A0A9BNN2_ARUDO
MVHIYYLGRRDPSKIAGSCMVQIFISLMSHNTNYVLFGWEQTT